MDSGNAPAFFAFVTSWDSRAMPTNHAIFAREQVSEQFAIAPGDLLRYEQRGLIHAVSKRPIGGYEPSEIRRIWTVVSLHRDLGINLAGVEAIVKLQSHMLEMHANLKKLAFRLTEMLEQGADHEG
jgi:MerR family transcriptional regulator/heat shock protein HspR